MIGVGGEHLVSPVRVSDVMECNQSIFNASALTTGVQRTISAARDCRNFWGVESRIGSMPASIRVLLIDFFGERCACCLGNLFYNRRGRRCRCE